MGVISVTGPKGGIGKTTLAANTAAALTKYLQITNSPDRVCLFDLDLRLPTLTSLLDCHPKKTFYDLFETLANKTYQIDFLHTLYGIHSTFQGYLDKELSADNPQLMKYFSLYKNLNIDLFHFSQFEFGDQMYELFFDRGQIHMIDHLKSLEQILRRIKIAELKKTLSEYQATSRPDPGEYINYIEEYGFSILGGEVPILGKKSHRLRINEPAFLDFFQEFLDEVFKNFEYVILDTPAGGINHLSSLMNAIDQVVLIFDMSNTIAVNGSIDALHSYFDYFEDFYNDYMQNRLTGMDKAYVDRIITHQGRDALEHTLKNKSIGIVFNRTSSHQEISIALDRLRDYLDTLEKYEIYKKRVQMVGMVPNNKIISIANNQGTLFYDKDRSLSESMNLISKNIFQNQKNCPTLENGNQEIIQYLQEKSKETFKFDRMADRLN